MFSALLKAANVGLLLAAGWVELRAEIVVGG
jgi:hypothetical protein